MPEHDIVETRNYFSDVPVESHGFHVRGANALDWGAKNRLSRIFNPTSGKTVMFAIDHGYFQGPTTGLERLDIAVPPLLHDADALMATRGAIRTSIDPAMNKPIAVGKEMTRDARYFRLACRIGAELGAQIIKVYYTEQEFDSIVSTCPVPIVVAGGKKVGEHEALVMAERAITEGAAGLDMGRNIFQSDHPLAMIKAVRAVVHEGVTAVDAFALYTELSN
jgi:DhnA family fructose-bisphosphate aldolase class Ia